MALAASLTLACGANDEEPPAATHTALPLSVDAAPTPGARDIATMRSIVSFSALARAEAASRAEIGAAVVYPSSRLAGTKLDVPASVVEASEELDDPPLGAIDGPLSPSPALSFSALDDNGTANPPDTHGAASDAHLMVTLNTEVAVQDRTGTILQRLSLDAFFASLGAPDVFDPKVLFDPYVQRFMVTAAADSKAPAFRRPRRR